MLHPPAGVALISFRGHSSQLFHHGFLHFSVSIAYSHDCDDVQLCVITHVKICLSYVFTLILQSLVLSYNAILSACIRVITSQQCYKPASNGFAFGELKY